MQVQVIGRAMHRFKDGEVLLTKLRVPCRSDVYREQKGQVGIVGIECPLLAEIELPISRDCGEERVEEVIALLV
jgi:hypothetical protein